MGLQHDHNSAPRRPDGSCAWCPPKLSLATLYAPWVSLVRRHLDRGESLPEVVAFLKVAGQPDTAVRIECWNRWWRVDPPRYRQAIKVLNAIRQNDHVYWNEDEPTAIVTDGNRLVEASGLVKRLLVP